MRGKRKAFSLIEVLIAIVITSMIIIVGFNLLRVSSLEFNLISKEYSVQNSVRSSMDNIEKVTKEATAVFTVGKDKFDPADLSTMTDGWSYIGLNEDGTKLINYIWVWTDQKAEKGFHKQVDITPSDWNVGKKDGKEVKYTIGFYRDENNKPLPKKDDPASGKKSEATLRNQKMIRIYLKGELEEGGQKNQTYTLNREILAENLNQVMDSRKKIDGEPITALAYKVDYLEDPVASASAAVVFVVDLSGSMLRGMDGKTADPTTNPSRISILKKRADKFVEELEKTGRIDLYFVPFDRRAYAQISDGSKDQSIYTRYEEIYSMVQNAEDGSLSLNRGAINFRMNQAIGMANTAKARYAALTWSDKGIEDEYKAIVKNIDSIISKASTQLPHTSNQSQILERAKLVRDLIRHTMELLTQPYTLSRSLAGTSSAQSLQAKNYIQNDMNPTPDGDTNLGAGIREGYKILQKSDRKYKYLVVLADGNTNFFDYQGPKYRFEVYTNHNTASQGRDKDYTAQKPYLKLTGRGKSYVKVDRSKGYLMPTKEDSSLYHFVDLGNGDYIDDRFERVALGDPQATHRYWTETAPLSRTLSWFPKKTAKPAKGKPIEIDYVLWSTGAANNHEHLKIGSPPYYFTAVNYIQELMSSGYGMNVKNPDGSYFIRQTFLIGFSGKSDEKWSMEYQIKGFSEAGGGTEKTEYFDASSDVSLESAFRDITDGIQKDLWYFEGP